KAAPVATGRVVMTIAGPDAVWSPAAMHGCRPQELQDVLNCMARFGAPREAVEFVRQSAEIGMEPGLLAGLQDFGTVDLARLDYIQPGREQALVLVNGGPAAVATENDGVQALPLDDPVFRRLVSRYGELKLFNDPRLESHRLMTRGEQRFTFAYRLAKCDTCATPGEMLVAFDFDAAGHYSGLTLLGITGRDPDQDWLAVNRPQAAVLQSDMAKLQRRLAGLGFEPGALDGEGGKQTETALLAVQADHGLKQSGEADERTVRLLAAPDIIVEVSRFEQIYTIATEPELVAFALRYGRGVLSRAQNALGESNVAVARMNSRVGRLYDRQRNYARALPFARKAVEVNIAAGLDKSQGHGLLLFNLGETLRQLGRKDEAVEKFEAAFDLFEPLATAGRDGQESDLTERNLAADALNRTGQKLIALYSQQERSWSVKRVKKRLETVEAQLAAAD
ncbi:MAG TPA: peptidoglycan-binding protein, partial [Afifellaceae bacterium]|nr:peptidoglycan-binding protein [Afifellaceae bacterium]